LASSIAAHANTIVDLGTGLEWLPLTDTAGLSYNFVASQLTQGGQFSGFAIATRMQVDQLFADFGLPITHTPQLITNNPLGDSVATPASPAAIQNFISIFGATDFSIYSVAAGAFGMFGPLGYGGTTDNLLVAGPWTWVTPNGTINDLPVGVVSDFSTGAFGTFLVRPTAVPGPIVGSGLPGLVMAAGSLLAWWRPQRKAT
jgi:hypothetical protein